MERTYKGIAARGFGPSEKALVIGPAIACERPGRRASSAAHNRRSGTPEHWAAPFQGWSFWLAPVGPRSAAPARCARTLGWWFGDPPPPCSSHIVHRTRRPRTPGRSEPRVGSDDVLAAWVLSDVSSGRSRSTSYLPLMNSRRSAFILPGSTIAIPWEPPGYTFKIA